MEGYKEDNPEDYTKEIILRSNKFIGRIGSLVYMKEEDLLIATIGAFVEIYKIGFSPNPIISFIPSPLKSNNKIFKLKYYLDNQRIYFLISSENLFIILEIKSLDSTLFDYSTIKYSVQEHFILDFQIIKKWSVIVLGLAQSQIAYLKYKLNTPESLSIEDKEGIINLSDPCIYYCISFQKERKGNQLFGCGTVFREILIFSLREESLMEKNKYERILILHRLMGHKGVIFQIEWTGEKELASASDDRSIKVWELGAEGNIHENKSLEGHTARVWDLEYIKGRDLLASVGEDSTLRLWGEGREIALFHPHRGKNICVVGEGDSCLFTGGLDGTIWVLNLHAYFSPHLYFSQWALPPPQGIKKVFQPMLKSIQIIQGEHFYILVATNFGSIHLIAAATGYSSTLYTDPLQSNISLLHVRGPFIYTLEPQEVKTEKTPQPISHNTDEIFYICFGDSLGNCTFLAFAPSAPTSELPLSNNMPLAKWKGSDCRIHNLYLWEKEKCADIHIFWLFTSTNRGLVTHWEIKVVSSSSVPEIWRVRDYSLNNPREIMRMLVLRGELDKDSNPSYNLLCGDTKGIITTFHIQNLQTDYTPTKLITPPINEIFQKEEIEIIEEDKECEEIKQEDIKEEEFSTKPIKGLKIMVTHSKERITMLKCYGEYVYSLAKDGKLNKYTFKDGDLKLIESKQIGFKDKKCIIWNLLQNNSVFSFPSKGGNRPTDVLFEEGDWNGVHFVAGYTAKNSLFWYNMTRDMGMSMDMVISKDMGVNKYMGISQHMDISKHLGSSFHGEEVTCMEVLETAREKYIITGSSDNNIGIYLLLPSPPYLRPLLTLSTHTAGVKSLHISPHSEYLVSGGGKMALHIFRIVQVEGQIEDILQHALHTVSTGAEVLDARIMGVASLLLGGGLLVGVGTSAGDFFLLGVEHEGGVSERGRMHVGDAVLALAFLLRGEGDILMFLGDTGGRVSCIRYCIGCTGELLLLYVFHPHQCGVNALSLFSDAVFCSVGDDQKLSIWGLDSDSESNPPHLLHQYSLYHQSSIRDLSIFPLTQPHAQHTQLNTSFYIATTAYDQTINILKCSLQGGVWNYNQLVREVHGVANSNSLRTIYIKQTNMLYVIIAGNGLQIMTTNFQL